MNKNEPIKLSPAVKDYLWGGTKLIEKYNKKTELEKCAETWELSARCGEASVVSSGDDAGISFVEYLEKNPESVGIRGKQFDFFPVLIKFIDAKDNLSVQVHPDDEYALKNHNEYGKTEVWYILDCEEDAELYYGFTKEISKDELKKRLTDNTILEVLNAVKVKKGDVFFIESGIVHAIGKGIVLCEIQQNSNITYRFYDYNRKDAQGNTRPLHIEQALEVSDLDKAKGYSNVETGELCSCKYFTVNKYKVNGSEQFSISEDSFKSVIVTEGDAILSLNNYQLELIKGDSVYIPAQNDSFTINGNCEIIVTNI